jgi:hypothetical protein
MYEDQNKINKAMVSIVIEKVLLNFGKAAYDKVIEILNKEYHCGLTDCYEHPEYLHKVLKKFFGNASNVVIESIKENLEEYKQQKQVAKFLKVISR